jgi:hypothetical protein
MAGEGQGQRIDPKPLICIECLRRVQPCEPARLWRAYLTHDGEAVVYCPACAAREFGPRA